MALREREAEWRCRQMARRLSGEAARTLGGLAAEHAKQSRELETEYRLRTGEVLPPFRAPRYPPPLSQMLRQSWLAAGRREQDYREALRSAGPELRESYERGAVLAQREQRQLRQLARRLTR